jgi:Inner membrane component of T3SS, cytoplasmic domain
MSQVTLQVLVGVDQGRIFRDLPTPLTIGRDAANQLHLNDDRVSRVHAKIQFEADDIILTDLDSTAGTQVNGRLVQICRLRPGDLIWVGQSLLLFGSDEQLSQPGVSSTEGSSLQTPLGPDSPTKPAPSKSRYIHFDWLVDFILDHMDEMAIRSGGLFIQNHPLPPWPVNWSPSDVARASEILDFLHRRLRRSTRTVQANAQGTEVVLSFGDWQRVLGVQMLLALYLRAIVD